MNFLERIKTFLAKSRKRPFKQFCTEYLKIKTELRLSDVNISGTELNFKISWRGKVVPFWVSSKYQTSDMVDLIAVGLASGMNLVEISQELKNLATFKNAV